MSPLKSKPVSASRVTLSQLMQPQHANSAGNVHGGWIMKLVDEAGALACMRFANRRVVTVAIDQMMFRQPIHIGNLVTLTAEVSYTGRTSMEAEVQVVAENPITGEQTHTNTAYLVYVALDENGQPTEVPQLIPETPAQRERMEQAKARQAFRLKQRAQVEAAEQSKG
ncbi:MAG: acyl-CoA thioesterase [Chloroflexi bacterium]|nr:acyl-CoA thioesterase [Chloroflexota bacterium]